MGDEQFYDRASGVEVRLGRDLGIDPKLLEAAADRIAAVAPASERAESLLVVVGRGTNDPDANANIAKVARMLWEGLGFGWAEAAFSGVAHPRVGAALDRAARLGFRRIVVFPVFPVHRGAGQTHLRRDRCRRRPFSGDRVRQGRLSARPPRVIDAFLDRIDECETGEPAMNCQLCKYRTRIVGYDDAVGAPQQGHHHHVRGAGVGHHHESRRTITDHRASHPASP